MSAPGNTESVHSVAGRLDGVSTLTWLEAMHAEDRRALAAVRLVLPQIAALSEAVASAIGSGGRLILGGAGTSGRLAALEAAECPPTFGTEAWQIVALMAGGCEALTRSVEGAEDDVAAGARGLDVLTAGQKDIVVGVSASGRTPFVAGFLQAAREHGCVTAAIVCNADAPLLSLADHPIVLDTGAEFVAGSTRLKAGTAQKLALNLMTTGAMRCLGRVRSGRMAALRATNTKLRRRAIGIVADLAGVSQSRAEQILDASGGDVALALERAGSEARQDSPSPLKVEMRNLIPDDALIVAALAAEPDVVASTAPFAALGGDALFREWLARPGLKRGAWHDGRLAGVALVERRNVLLREHVADVTYLAVATWARGGGVGDRLIADALSWAIGQRLTRVELRVWPDNVPAVRLYERHGFEVEGRLRAHAVVEGRYRDALMMAWVDPGLGRD